MKHDSTNPPDGASPSARAFADARQRLESMVDAHTRGRHYMRWTGSIRGGRRVLGCMFCGRRTLDTVG
jgi:hypothetical protein